MGIKQLFERIFAKKQEQQNEEVLSFTPEVPGFTLLTKEQIFGKGQLDVIKKYGTQVAPTDLVALLGCHTDVSENPDSFLTCHSYTASSTQERSVYGLVAAGGGYGFINNARSASARPVLPPSETIQLTPTAKKKGINGIDIIEYGEYPQMLADEITRRKLERQFNAGTLISTGKVYTFNKTLYNYNASFDPWPFIEYEYDGKRYIRFEGMRVHSGSRQLTTGEKIEERKPYWVEVQPIEWLADPTGIWVSKKALFSGVQFDMKRDYDGNFSKTFMKQYLDTYFAKEIEPSEQTEERQKRLKREETIKDLKTKLAEAIDPEKVKAKIGFTRTESRREIAEAIKTTRRARDVFIDAGKKAQKEGDQELIDQILEMADFYVRSDQAQRRAARQRRAEYRAQRAAAKKDSER